MAQKQQIDNDKIIIISDDEGEGNESVINFLPDSDKSMSTDSDNDQCCYGDSCYICLEEAVEDAEEEENNPGYPGFRIEDDNWEIILTFGDTVMIYNSSNREQLTQFIISLLHEIEILEFFNVRFY